MTNQQIAKIAKATKQICSPNGYGRQVVVFADGRTVEAVSQNDCVAINSGDGWEYPIARLHWPMSRAEVRAEIGRAEEALRLL